MNLPPRAARRFFAGSLFVASFLTLAACKKDPTPSAGAVTSLPPAQAATAQANAGEKHFKEVFLMSSDGELETLLGREAKTARAMGLQPFVEIGASWCLPCQKLEQNMQHPKVEEAFRGTYIIHLDSDDWGNKLASAGVAPRAIPVFFEIGEDGKSTGRRIQGGDWGSSIETMAIKLHAFFRKA